MGNTKLSMKDFDGAWDYLPTRKIGDPVQGLDVPLMNTAEFDPPQGGGDPNWQFCEVVDAITQRLKRQAQSETFADRADFQGFGDWWEWLWDKGPVDEDGTLIYATEEETLQAKKKAEAMKVKFDIPVKNAEMKYGEGVKLFREEAAPNAPRVHVGGVSVPPSFDKLVKRDTPLHLFMFDPAKTRAFTGEKIRRGIRNFFTKRELNYCAHRKGITQFVQFLSGIGNFFIGDKYEWIRQSYRNSEGIVDPNTPVVDAYIREWAYRRAQDDLMQEPIFTIVRDEQNFRDDMFVPYEPVGHRIKEYITALLCIFPRNKNVHLLVTTFKAYTQGGVKCWVELMNCAGGMELIPTPDFPVLSSAGRDYKASLLELPSVFDLSKYNPKTYEYPPRTTTEWQATCVVVASGIGSDLQTIRDVGACICVAAVYMAAKSLFNVFFAECPSWFHATTYTRNGNELRGHKGGDKDQGNFSRNARAARLSKENVNHSDGTFQSSFDQHHRDFSVSKNVWVLRLKYLGGHSSYCEGIFMDSRQIAFTWHAHAAYASDVLVEISLFPDHPSAGVKTALVLNQSMFSINRPDKNRDLGFVILNKAYMQGVRSLWGLVPSRSDAQPTYNNVFRIVSGVYNGQNMTLPEGPFPATLVKDSKTRIAYQDGLIVYEDVGLTYYIIAEGKGEAGDCGFPYLCATSDKPLLGMHHARCGNDSFMVPFFSEDNCMPVMQSGLTKGVFMDNECEGTPPPVRPTVQSNEVVYQPSKHYDETLPMDLEDKVDPTVPGEHIPGAKYVGKLAPDIKSFSSPPKSKFFLRSPEYLEQAPKEHVKFPAPMNRKARRNRLNATFNFGETPCPDLAHTEDPKWARAFAPISKTFKGFLTFEQALFGDPNLGLSSFASSSKFVGHFYNEQKIELVNFLTKTYHPKLKERVMRYFERAKKQEIFPLVAQFAKDELLDREKVDENLCRLINGHDLAYNIFLRMLTGMYVNMINSHPARVVPATGVNPLSHEWKVIHDTATVYTHILAGDLSKQEATTNQQMRDAFIAHVMSYYCLTEEEITVLRNGLAGLNMYYFEKDGHLYMAMKGHSSGHFLTTIYNSFCTWFCHKTAFEAAFDPEEAVFEEEVALRTTGDDSFGSVSDKAAERYDMLFISKFLKETMGIKYTGADKNAELVPFTTLADATFLGRSFRNHVDGRLVGPLRESAIHDLVIWSIKVPGFTQEQVDDIRIEQAMRESVLHGHVFYNDVRTKVMKFYHDRHGRAPSIPRFHDMNKKVIANWYKCDFDGLAMDRPNKAATAW
jgi:hypothetical protein